MSHRLLLLILLGASVLEEILVIRLLNSHI